MKTKLRFLTEEGHTRARNTFQRVRLFAAFMFLAAALAGVALHFYWVKPNLTPLQRIYLRQYVRSTFKSYMPRSRSRYTFLTGVVRDPSNGRDVRIMMHDGLVKADFDDDGRIKVKNGYPVFYLQPDAHVKEFAWTNEFLIDATAYGWFRCLIYDDLSLIDLWRPAWLGAIVIFLSGTGGLTGLYLFAQRRYVAGQPLRGTRELSPRQYRREHRKHTGYALTVYPQVMSLRPDRANGYAAPQLHTHVVIFNMTETEAGKVRSVQPLELYRSQKYATAIYRAHLAEKLQGLGYEIEVDPRTGAPEIKGFSQAYLQESSPRREEVLKEAEQMKERLEREGNTVSENARLKQAAAHNDRASKRYDRVEMRDRALAMDAKHGNQARWLVSHAQERGPLQLAQDEVATRAQEAVTFARDNAVEREAVADMRQVMTDALRRNLGLTTHDAVTSEMRRRQERGEFIDIIREHRSPEATTQRMLKMEQENIQTVMNGKGSSPAIVRAARVEDVVANSAQNHQLKLNANQQSALETILSSEDQILGLQGGAGTGKTTVLSALRDAAEKEGYQVRGFAPTTRAAKQLAESGIETETLQKFLRRRQEPTTSKQLFVLDESSLASTKQLHKFFGRLEAEDKVFLVGDVRQHQAVEAGSPFEQLQKHGMTTAQLNEIVRQRDPELKQTVAKLSVRNIREAVAELESRGKVIEIPSERERFERMAQDYCKQPTNTLVISPANRERAQLNSVIHQQLQREGKVSRDDYQMNVYVNRQDMTGAERTFANSYRPNEDTIRYNRASKAYKVKPGDYASVIGVNHERNELTVRFANGRTLTYDPTRLSGVSVYNEAERFFAEGDRIQFRAPIAEKRIVNGELGSISKIEPEHLRVALDSGREVSFDPQQFRHIDHGYAVTSHSSQGLTVDRVLINADTQESLRLLNDRMAYVAVSRAREEALIYTDSTQNLRETLNRGTNKEMALEATKGNSRDIQQDRNALTNDPLATHEQPHNECVHGINPNSPQIDPTQTPAAELAVESESEEIAAFLM